jgi:predicted dehydrogenase
MKNHIGVVGCGYWGPKLIRNFVRHTSVENVHCVDLNPDRLRAMEKLFTGIRCHDDIEALLRDNTVGIVAIATPCETHYGLAKKSLLAGKHILVEKPFTSSVAEAEELVAIGDRNNLIIMVDHTFLFTGAVRKIKDLVDKNVLGELIYYDSVRINLGLFQRDINVVWDLATHDFSIMDYLFSHKAVSVNCVGKKLKPFKHESIAFCTVNLENGAIAHCNVSWMSPVKIRRIFVGGTDKMLLYDDILPSEKVKVYDKSVKILDDPEEIYEELVQYRTGDMYAPRISEAEALYLECQYLLECIEKEQKPFNDGESGLRVVRLLEAAQRSIESGGNTIKLSSP